MMDGECGDNMDLCMSRIKTSCLTFMRLVMYHFDINFRVYFIVNHQILILGALVLQVGRSVKNRGND